MKYGLTRDEKFPRSKKRWKIAMEHEINCLRFEMSTLKACLLDCTSKIKQLNQLSVENSPSIPSITKGCEQNQFLRSEGKNVWTGNRYTFEVIEVENKKCNVFPKAQLSSATSNSGPTTYFGFNTSPNGTRGTAYRSTLDLDTPKNTMPVPVRVISITAMPEYTNWSPEELRVQDYSIAEPCHHLQFFDYGLKGQFCGTELERFHPVWDTDPVTRIPTSHHCITAIPVYINKSFEELRLEDYILKSIGVHNQMKCKDSKLRSIRTRITNPPYKSKPENRTITKAKPGNQYLWERDFIRPDVESVNKLKVVWTPFESHLQERYQNPFDVTNKTSSEATELDSIGDNRSSARQEEKLSQLVSTVKNIDTQLSTMNSRQTSVDSHLLEISAQLSVMDSRLSSVDMFVTMQRFHKMWHFLEPRLLALEATPYTANVDLSTKIEQVESNIAGGSTFSEETLGFSTKPDNLLEAKSVSNRNSLMDISDVTNIVSFTESVGLQNMSATSNSSDLLKSSDLLETSMSNSPDPNSKNVAKDIGSKVNKLEMDNPGENSLLTTNLVEQSVRFDVHVASSQNIEVDPRSRSCSSIGVDEVENKYVPHNISTHQEKDISSVNDNVNPSEPIVLTINKVKNEENIQEENEPKIPTNEQNTSDEENDFVMIEKPEVAKFPCFEEEEKLECSSVVESSSNDNSDFKIFNDITEYLEVNLGKDKGSVYQFGFEAKQNFSGGDSLGNTFCTSNKDDSLGHTSCDCSKESNLDGSQSNVKSSKDDSFLTFLSVFAEDSSGKPNQSSPIIKGNTKSESFPKK